MADLRMKWTWVVNVIVVVGVLAILAAVLYGFYTSLSIGVK